MDTSFERTAEHRRKMEERIADLPSVVGEPVYSNPDQPPPPPPPSRPGTGSTFFSSCLVAGCATLLAPFAIMFGLAVLVYFVSSSGLGDVGSAFDSSATVLEKELRPGTTGAGTIALVTIHGVIAGDGSSLESDGPLAYVCEQLRAAARDKNVKAVVLQIDSPGGGLSASDIIHNQVLKLRAAGKKVVAWGGGLMASGGYYVAVAAESVVASPTATVGSIGVVMQHFQVAGLLDKLGVKVDPITAGDKKDMGSMFREMTPAERDYLQRYIDQSHERFIRIVSEGRNLPDAQVRALADGGIFTADEALEKKLVDEVGYMDDALARAEHLACGKGMRVVTYKRILSLGDLLGNAGRGAGQAMMEAATEAPAPRAMAVWDGGER